MQTTKYNRITNNEREQISRSLAIGIAEKVDIVPSQRADERKNQPDQGAEEKPD